MFAEENIVQSKGYGKKLPESAIVISSDQFALNINLSIVNALPKYNEDGTVLTDADLTLLEDQ